MKKIFIIGIFILFILGCGLYTNIPSQVHIVQDKDSPLIAKVIYNTDSNKITYTIQNPTLTLETEPGSIGVTYNKISIKYLPEEYLSQYKITTNVVITGELRVGSSHFRDKDGNLIISRGSTELPVINPQIIALGTPQSHGGSGISTQISAEVLLEGTDDAGFPASFTVNIPINFLISGK